MTYEEAHRFLEVKQRDMTQNRHLYNETAIAINGKAIEALEKQIPKKPLLVPEGESKIHTFKCPTCGSYRVRKFCDDCGQKLWWKETEE